MIASLSQVFRDRLQPLTARSRIREKAAHEGPAGGIAVLRQRPQDAVTRMVVPPPIEDRLQLGERLAGRWVREMARDVFCKTRENFGSVVFRLRLRAKVT